MSENRKQQIQNKQRNNNKNNDNNNQNPIQDGAYHKKQEQVVRPVFLYS